MNIIRRTFKGAVLASALVVSASAATVQYTSSSALTTTDITDSPVAMTPFQAGVGGVPSDAVLQSFTVEYDETINGSFTQITNTSPSPEGITVTIDSLGLLYLFTSTPSGDLPINSMSPPSDDAFRGMGPDPSYRKTVNLAASTATGSSAGPFSYNKSQSAVTGTISDSTSLSDVEAAWNVYLDSATNLSTTVGGSGTGNASYSNSVGGNVIVTYTYTEISGTPEPTTMVLFGSALVGLGLLRKRASKT
jgi:hypothetical protein